MAASTFKVAILFSAVLFCMCMVKPLENEGKHWAVIVAGSNTYGNYRHQADICHAYHVLRDHGVAEDNIIVMMYDDIAYSSENPDQGSIINRPGGENVYKGVKIDYKSKDVTPEVFLSVLRGEKDGVLGRGTGRVLESGPNDHVFINFADHGAPGLVAFPNSVLHARDFMSALKSMNTKDMYAQMVIYIEACESGSMFKGLLTSALNIYATTASSSTESSFACYYDHHLHTYLGDVYSVKWMENSDVANLNKETLNSQFDIVKKETNVSHVQEFGDISMGKEPVGDFQGNTPSSKDIYYPEIDLDAVRSHDVDIQTLNNRIATSTSDEEREYLTVKLDREFQHRDDVSLEMKHIVAVALNHNHLQVADAMSTRSEDFNFDCYEAAVDSYFSICRKLNKEPFALRVLYALQNVCNVEGMKPETITSAMNKIC